MKALYRIVLSGFLFLSSLLPVLSCTTAVISGKFTRSGRPMIWKIRDTESYCNHVRRFWSPIGYYVGLMNDSDREGSQLWGGHNSHGFAIMNSASFNVNQGDTTLLADREGIVMKQALESCCSLADFENLLNHLPRPMGLAAHFGVIDAEGGAAFYEVNNYTWTKFDATQAPRGYILRTNYSQTGTSNKGYGYVRMRTAQKLFDALSVGSLTVELLGSTLSRSMLHSQLGVDFRQQAEEGLLVGDRAFVNSDDLLVRYGTASMILVEGVRSGEAPELTTSWIQSAIPYLSPLIPVWTWSEVPWALQLPTEGKPKTLAQWGMELKKKLYPLQTVEESRYLYIPLIYQNKEVSAGLAQRLEFLEQRYIPQIQQAETPSKRLRLQQQLIAESLALLEQVATQKEALL